MTGSRKGMINVAAGRDPVIYLLVVALTWIALWSVLDNFVQTVAGTVFIAIVVATLMFWRFRLAIAFIGISVLLMTGTLDIPNMIQFMNLDVITFLVAMMVLVDIAREGGFFAWLLDKLLKGTHYDPKRVMIVLLVMSMAMAAMIDEVTSILFIMAIVFEYCSFFEIEPLPYLISTVLATNVGSSATMLGNPIGILIGLRGDLTFEDFVIWAAPVALISLLVLIAVCTLWYRKALAEAKSKVSVKMKGLADAPASQTMNPAKVRDVRLSGILLLGTIFVVAIHYRLEVLLGMPKFTYLLVGAFMGAGIGLTWKRAKASLIIERGVDWWTLVFFMFLFAKAGALKYTGLTDRLADGIASIATSQLQIQTFVLWFSSFASSVLDNVVLVAALIPVVQSLAGLGFLSRPLWWALLFGGVYGGNITMIGSTANIAAIGMLEKRFSYRMKFFKWFWIGLVGGVLPTLIAQIWLTIFFH